MIEAMFEGLSMLMSPTILLWIFIGIMYSTVIAIIPGLGGVFAVAILLPVVYALGPEVGLTLLVAIMAVDGTANTVTSVLFGVPGSATTAASIFDGYPMAKRGEAARAIAAGLTASCVGGVFGAIILAFLLPFVRPLVLSLGSPEFFMLIFAALLFMAYVGEGSLLKALISGFMGLMLSFVGLEISTATTRFTFGSLYLMDGIRLVPLFMGMFAITEMINLLCRGGSIANRKPATSIRSQTWQGIGDVFRNWKATMVSSTSGIFVGLAPGLGAAAGQFIAYGQVMRLSKNRDKFGTGEVEGVIAADAATNAKDGASMVPTFAFGIPGSSVMALFLAAMIGMGVRPGPEMLTTNLHLIWMFIFTLVIANIIGTSVCLLFSGQLARITNVTVSILVPPILVVSLFGSYSSSRHIGDIWVMLGAGILGYAMTRFGYSRSTFVIGFVLGIMLERHYLLSMRLFGLSFLTRPVVIGIMAVMFLLLVVPYLERLKARRRSKKLEDQLDREPAK